MPCAALFCFRAGLAFAAAPRHGFLLQNMMYFPLCLNQPQLTCCLFVFCAQVQIQVVELRTGEDRNWRFAGLAGGGCYCRRCCGGDIERLPHMVGACVPLYNICTLPLDLQLIIGGLDLMSVEGIVAVLSPAFVFVDPFFSGTFIFRTVCHVLYYVQPRNLLKQGHHLAACAPVLTRIARGPLNCDCVVICGRR